MAFRKTTKKAIQLFFSAAAVGDNNGARNVLYLEGFGVPKDYAKGMDWLKAAAPMGIRWLSSTLEKFIPK